MKTVWRFLKKLRIVFVFVFIIYSLPGIMCGCPFRPKQPNDCGWFNPTVVGRGTRHQIQVWMVPTLCLCPVLCCQGAGRVRVGRVGEISSEERSRALLGCTEQQASLPPNVSNWPFQLCSVWGWGDFFHGILLINDLGCKLARIGFLTVIKSWES